MIPTHVIFAIAGPTAGFILSVILYLGKRNLDEMTSTLSKVQHTLTELRVEIPKSYVTKEELLSHMHAEEQWHSHITQQLRDIREEISSVRDWTHHRQ
jgi:hypothetical protein